MRRSGRRTNARSVSEDRHRRGLHARNTPPPRSSAGSSPHERTSGTKSGTASLAIPVAKRPLELENVPRIPERHRSGRAREAERSRARQNRGALVTQHARANCTSRRPSHIRRQSVAFARSSRQRRAIRRRQQASRPSTAAITGRTTLEPAFSATRGSRFGPWHRARRCRSNPHHRHRQPPSSCLGT
jgi:hypothetical protein